LPHPDVEIDGGGHGLIGLADRSQPNGAQRASDLRPVHGDDLAQWIGIERLFGCAQDRVLGKHMDLDPAKIEAEPKEFAA
jgi:hypothetical protein